MKLFVWDYHGTLEKGNERGALEISNEVLQHFGYAQRFSAKDSIDLYGLKWYQYFEYLLPGEPHERHVELQHACFEWPEAEAIVARYIQQNDHAAEVLGAIRAHGDAQMLISNTSDRALPIFVRLVGLQDYFDASNAFAVAGHTRDVLRTKRHVLDEYIARIGQSDEIVLVGDSQSDMEIITGDNVAGYWYRHPELPMAATDNPRIRPINDLRDVLHELNKETD